jgi:hypothetical protein
MPEGFISARDVYSSLGYTQWRNFRSVVRRAQNLIRNGVRLGTIIEDTRLVSIGSGAKRRVLDYLMDVDAFEIVRELASSFKLNRLYSARNETALLGLQKSTAN